MTALVCPTRSQFAEENHSVHLILFVWMGVQFLTRYSVGKTLLELIRKTVFLVNLLDLKKILKIFSVFDVYQR